MLKPTNFLDLRFRWNNKHFLLEPREEAHLARRKWPNAAAKHAAGFQAKIPGRRSLES